MTGARTGVTERELQVLRFVGEQYAVPLGVLADMLVQDAAVSIGDRLPRASAERMVRRLAANLERLGYAGRRPLLGQQWLIPSRAGLRAAGLPYAAQTPAPILLKHVAAVARLRLHLERAYPAGEWECERAIRAHWQGTKVRRVDGALHWPDGGATGLEVELHVKKLPRYQGIVHDLDPTWGEVWWFTPPQHIATLAARLREAGGGDLHQVYGLPERVAL